MILAFKVSDEVGDGGEVTIGAGWVVGASNNWARKSTIHFSVG